MIIMCFLPKGRSYRARSLHAFLSWATFNFIISYPYIVYNLVCPPSSILLSIYQTHQCFIVTIPCVYRIQHPNQFLLLLPMTSETLLSSPTFSTTSSFITLAFQEILSIVLHVHILKTCNLLSSSFLNLQVSILYRNTLQAKHFTILFLIFMFSGTQNNLFFY